MRPFRRRRRGGVVATFEPEEAYVLANLAGQVVELLRDRNGAPESDPDPLALQLGMGGPSLPPEDPVLRRLYTANPTVQFIEAFHRVLYDLRWPTLWNFAYLTVAAVLSMAVGLWVFNRFDGDLAEEL